MARNQMTRRSVLAIGVTTAISSFPTPALVRSYVPVELCLLLDNSTSMFSEYVTMANGSRVKHIDIQNAGHIGALRSPGVRNLLVSQQVFVRVVAWSSDQRPLAAQQINVPDDVDLLIAKMQAAFPTGPIWGGGTRHAEILKYVIETVPRVGDRRVIDLSTDQAVAPFSVAGAEQARTMCEYQGDTINAITVDGSSSQYVMQSVRKYIVTREPKGFGMNVTSWRGYPEAIERKVHYDLLM